MLVLGLGLRLLLVRHCLTSPPCRAASCRVCQGAAAGSPPAPSRACPAALWPTPARHMSALLPSWQRQHPALGPSSSRRCRRITAAALSGRCNGGSLRGRRKGSGGGGSLASVCCGCGCGLLANWRRRGRCLAAVFDAGWCGTAGSVPPAVLPPVVLLPAILPPASATPSPLAPTKLLLRLSPAVAAMAPAPAAALATVGSTVAPAPAPAATAATGLRGCLGCRWASLGCMRLLVLLLLCWLVANSLPVAFGQLCRQTGRQAARWKPLSVRPAGRHVRRPAGSIASKQQEQ